MYFDHIKNKFYEDGFSSECLITASIQHKLEETVNTVVFNHSNVATP